MKRRALLLICLLLLVSVSAAAAQSDVTYTEVARIGRGSVHELFWSPDGTTLAALTARGIWFYPAHDLTLPPRLIELDPQPTLSESARWMYRSPGFAFDTTWERLVIDRQEDGVLIYDVASGDVLTRLDSYAARRYQSFAFSPDGQTLAAGVHSNSDLYLDFYDTESGALLHSLKDASNYAAFAMIYSPDGRYLVISGSIVGGDYRQDQLLILDLETDALVFAGDEDSVPPALDIPPVYYATYTAPTLLALGTAAEPFAVHFIEDSSAGAIAPATESYLTQAARYRQMQIKDVATGDVLFEYPVDLDRAVLSASAFAPDGARLAIVESSGKIVILGTALPPEDYDGDIFGCPIWDDACLTATAAHMLIIPELETVTDPGTGTLADEQYASPDGRWRVDLGWQDENLVRVTRVVDGEVFVLGLGDPLPILDPEEGGGPTTESGHNPNIQSARVSPDGRWLALAFGTNYMDGAADRVVRVYDVSGAEPLAEPVALILHNASPLALAFSADSQTLASSNAGSDVLVWNTADWTQSAALLHSNDVTKMAFTSTGDLLTLDRDGILHIWSPQ